jgi:predicted GH43/DUF377 family glycosyl hydrolase
MRKIDLIVVLSFIIQASFSFCFALKKQGVDNLDVNKMIQPIPITAKFEQQSYFVWCGTLVKGQDNLYHLFYSRWLKKYGFNAWVTSSEVAHAVGNSPTGPFEFKDVALPARGKQYWDGLCTHNPTVQFYNGKYYLYYMGNTGDGVIIASQSNTDDESTEKDIAKKEMAKNGLNWVHRNNQRIGVAVAENPNGPWKRFDVPLVDTSKDTTAHDALLTANPSVTQMPDGRFLMLYKGVAKKNKMPFGGPVVHLTAISKTPTGPFVKQNMPIFTAKGTAFAAEDPYVWYQDGCYHAIVKDYQGVFTKQGQSLALFFSKNGLDWKMAKNTLVSTLEIKWENGKIEKVEHLERPQLFFEDGKPTVLLVAGDMDKITSFNLQIPLR